KPLPTKFCFGDVVLDFGLDEDSEPMHIVPNLNLKPSTSSTKAVKPRRLPTKFKEKAPPKIRKTIPKSTDKIEATSTNREYLTDRPLSPSPNVVIEDSKIDIPSSDEIWNSYTKVKQNSIPITEADWPVCLAGGKHGSKTPPPQTINFYEYDDVADLPEDNGTAEELYDWGLNRDVQNDSKPSGRCDDEEVLKRKMEIGSDEERALREWIKSELLNEPLSDIDEFDMLLSLAKDYPKNHNILFELLKPKNTFTAKPAKKPLPKTIVRAAIKVEPKDAQKNRPILQDIKQEPISYVRRQAVVKVPIIKTEPIDPSDNAELPREELRPERPEILEVKDIGSVPPKPQDEEAIQDWLQQCSNTISAQLQSIIYSELAIKPGSSVPGAIDFENEINKEQMRPRSPGKYARTLAAETGWQSSFRVRLEDFEDIIDLNMTEFRDPQEKRIRSKWNQQYGLKSAENLKRSLVLPPLPVSLDKCLLKIRILRRPAKRKVEDLRLRIEMKFCKMFCTLQLNRNMLLRAAVNRLDNAIYNSDIDVIQKRYAATQIAWIWANGTVMIINGRGQSMLAETQRELMAKLTGQANFKANASHKLLHLRLVSYAYYPWRIALAEFSEAYALCSEPLRSEMHYVYYVDRTLPGVAARVHQSGMIHVFAMTTAQADKMLEKLYLITANHRLAEINAIKSEPNLAIID
ncbi:hypothetical protein KR009_005027, partial [Drosophila setifemur]